MTGYRIRPVAPEVPKVARRMGRPPLVDKVCTGFKLERALLDKARRIGGTMSNGIRIAVMAYPEQSLNQSLNSRAN